MTSIWRRGTQPAKFRIAWRGYDRAEVDDCLRRADADRERLQEEVAQLSAMPFGLEFGDNGRGYLSRCQRQPEHFRFLSQGA